MNLVGSIGRNDRGGEVHVVVSSLTSLTPQQRKAEKVENFKKQISEYKKQAYAMFAIMGTLTAIAIYARVTHNLTLLKPIVGALVTGALAFSGDIFLKVRYLKKNYEEELKEYIEAKQRQLMHLIPMNNSHRVGYTAIK